MADEHSLNFFHGAILDEDADVFLVQDGDYLIQAKPDGRFGPPKLILAVKKGPTKIRKIDIVKIEGAGYRFMGKTYADLQKLINKFSTRPLELANGDTILLKRPIPKGKFSFNHKDICLQRKIHSDAYGTVFKGVMVKDDHPIIVKRIDSYGKNDQALFDIMKEARENDPNFYGLIFDRMPYLLVMHDVSATQSTVPIPLFSDLFSSERSRSSSINVVNNDLNAYILPPNRPLVSYSVSTTSSISDHEFITTASTQNSQADLSNLGNENIELSIIPSLEQSSSDVTYSSGYSLDSGTVDYAWLARCAETDAIVKNFKPLDFNYRVYRDWRRSLSPKRFRNKVIECASLSSGESSSESEDDEEINTELPPRYYNDTNDLSDEEPDSEETIIIIQKCWSIFGNFRFYWGAVRKLAEDRQSIIKRLKKQLSKKRTFSDDQIAHINARVKLIEEMLNSTIPIVPCWKVSYQNGTDKKIIIRKGYIYERIGETNEFKCIYKKGHPFEQCRSFIVVDHSDTMIEGSFCFHNHPAADNEEYTEDVPPPPETPISLQRVTNEEEKCEKYSKLIKLLKEILIELIDWRCHVNVCLENLKLIRGYLNDLENADNLRLSSRTYNPSLIVLKETKNLLNCIRLDCL